MIIRELVTKLGFQFDGTVLARADKKVSDFKTNAVGLASVMGQQSAGIMGVNAALGQSNALIAGVSSSMTVLAKNTQPAVKQVSELTNKLKDLATLFASGAIVKYIVNMVHHAVELGSRIQDTSDRFGVATESLQRFQYVAAMNGVRAEQFNDALAPLSRSIYAAGHGSKEAAAQFTKYGIALKDSHGKLLPTEEVIGNIAEAVSKVKDPAEAAGLAMKFFGRNGAKLVPVLKKGRQGLHAAMQELDQLGGPVSADTINALANLGDRVEVVDGAFENLKMTVVAGLVPAFTAIINYVGGAIGTFKRWIEASHIAQAAFIALGTVIGFFALRALVAMAPVLIPLGLIAAGVVLLTLAFEDMWVTLKGGDSLLGRFVKWCDDSNTSATGLLKTIHDIGHAVFGLGEKVYDALHPFEPKAGDQNDPANSPMQGYNDAYGGFTNTDGKRFKRIKPENKGDPLGRWLHGDAPDMYLPAEGDTAGLAPMNGNSDFGTLAGGAELGPMRDRNGFGSMQTTNNTEVKIEVHPSQGMNEEQLAVFTKQQFDNHFGKVVKNARAATLPSAPSGNQ